ncbi:MAG TPA: bifunctional DNA-binding transcriptional regulator/O6-methylguanine-DNA methyltransferase Ada [Terriglobales bacterium]|jgi:AraC family transcriptional regulator of adaptative response/methylated-DNA-[protein]-cysteine methyltransferase|nr:bifunctional DNA-binding transcriptional regulator/O6-methylguanine-DNA methyltransferase Ada [Terriglobales bacterium]
MSSDNQDRRWQAVTARDASRDGVFVFAVTSTGVYCRPSCPSRRPRRDRVRFFSRPDEAERAGFRACLRCRPRDPDPRTRTVESICQFLREHADEPVTLATLGERFRMNPFHLQRVFKSVTGVSPREYADAIRMKSFKSQLRSGRSVTDAIYEAGFGSSSRLYERSGPQLGMTPATYQRGGKGLFVRYTTLDSPVGRMLLAATDHGVCAISFADSDGALLEGLRREFPDATIRRGDVVLRRWVRALLDQLHGERPLPQLPLDIQATAFQRRVWEHLRSIPYGTTKSYGEVACAIGQASGARAVARACASNPVAVAIPCHRVVRGTGDLGGYRWGLERKKALLAMEQSAGKEQ